MRTHHAAHAGTGFSLLLLIILAQALAVPATAQAHGDTVKVVVTGQRDGHVTTEITWENDGDTVEETIAATVNATSPDGTRTLGPWPLVRTPGTRTGWTTTEALTPGTWNITVDVGFPALGHTEREVQVPVIDPSPPAPRPTPTTTVPASTTPAPTPTAQAPASTTPAPARTDPADKRDDRATGWPLAGLAGIALTGAAAGMLLRRTRTRTR
ncbi:hypothetical protein [Streptomyces sp. NPDC093089]|uniref:hypothetical protein n=1 Tax=Streptomyces sp. NPDC093089 TaxID=3366024 RepID=UPI0037F5C92A